MSHQSGITANDELKDKFAQIKDGHVRVLALVIENEVLVVKAEENVEGTFDDDFDRIIPPLVQPKSPAFYFVRLDTTNESSGHNWLLIVYIPDEAKVRERMLYASTIATLKREFGLTYITQEIRTSTPTEMTSQSFHQFMRSQAAPPPQRRDEEEMSEIRRLENNSDIGVHTKRQTLQGLMFPFDENVIEALHLFKKEDVDYVQMEIDYEKELIRLSHSEANVTPEQIQKILPENAGRYHVYRFKHEFNNESISSVLFLYSVPGHGNKIQLRMVYASCKESVIETIQKQYGIAVDRKLELSDANDLTNDHLFKEVHPEATANAGKSTFSKPKAPTRGPRRLVKTAEEN